MKLTSKFEGGRELEAAFNELGNKTLERGVMRAELREMAQPIADDYAAGVDEKTGHLKSTIGVGIKLTRRQQKFARKEGKSYVEVYAGAGNDPAAHLEEFGSVHNKPNPALRRAWDQHSGKLLDGLAARLWGRIDIARAKLAKRQAALLRKMGKAS